jgi:hypothetical protein
MAAPPPSLTPLEVRNRVEYLELQYYLLQWYREPHSLMFLWEEACFNPEHMLNIVSPTPYFRVTGFNYHFTLPSGNVRSKIGFLMEVVGFEDFHMIIFNDGDCKLRARSHMEKHYMNYIACLILTRLTRRRS